MKSAFKMIDVGSKPITRRVAIARGEIQLTDKVRRAIEENQVPKGDVLTLAEVAGVIAAKKTAEILPLCHPLTLDSVRVQTELDPANNKVMVNCEVTTHGKTGVEMEALSGVSGALLCIYDLTKSIDKGAVISGIRLEHKEGGRSGSWWNSESNQDRSRPQDLARLRAAVLTVSDRCSRGESEDLSGSLLASYLGEHGAELSEVVVLPDEAVQIREKIQHFSEKERLDLVLVTGGTGIGPRDVTPEALQPLWSKNLPGFGELFRSKGLLNTPRAWLSRADAGLVGNTLVVLLPGSPSGVKDGLAVLDQMLPHMIAMIRGGKH